MKQRPIAREVLSLAEVQERGYAALSRELGPEGMIRFLQSIGVGKGDYTATRMQWLGSHTLDDIATGIKAMRARRRRRVTATARPAKAPG